MEEGDFEFEFDFSNLGSVELSKEKISYTEIKSVFYNKYSVLFDYSREEKGFYYMIGFSEKRRFLNLHFIVQEISIKILTISIANEDQIRKYYAGKK